MYLGYGERKNTIVNDPMYGFNVNEVLINLDLTFVSKRNIYIDSLLGYGSFQNCTTEHVISEDLSGVFYQPEDSMERSLVKTFQEDGFAQHVVRLLCVDNTVLYVLAKVFLHIDQDNVPVMISYSVPFAFSSQSQRTIDEGMRMITTNEQWLALVPSFFTPPESPLALEDISPVVPLPETPPSDLPFHSPESLMTFPHKNTHMVPSSDPCSIEEILPVRNTDPSLNLMDVLELL